MDPLLFSYFLLGMPAVFLIVGLIITSIGVLRSLKNSKEKNKKGIGVFLVGPGLLLIGLIMGVWVWNSLQGA